jgi:hypothetical protein
MRIALLLSLLVFYVFEVAASPTLLQVIQTELPKNLKAIQLAQSTRQEVQKILGKPLSGSNQKREFYQSEGTQADVNDLTINYKKDIVSAIYFEHDFAFTLMDLMNFMSAKELEKAQALDKKQQKGHEAGRFFSVEIPKEGLKLKFLMSEKKNLRSVYFFSPLSKKP